MTPDLTIRMIRIVRKGVDRLTTAQTWKGRRLPAERIEEIRKEIERLDNDTHGCDGCGCSCCTFAEELLDHADWVDSWGGL